MTDLLPRLDEPGTGNPDDIVHMVEVHPITHQPISDRTLCGLLLSEVGGPSDDPCTCPMCWLAFDQYDGATIV